MFIDKNESFLRYQALKEAIQLRITLVDPSPFSLWGKGVKAGQYPTMEPFGLCQLVSFLEREGHQVTLCRTDTTEIPQETKGILASRPDLVGFSAMTYNFNFACNIARHTKAAQPKLPIIFGGVHPTMVASTIEEGSIDHIVVGEGERPMRDLARALEGGDVLPRILHRPRIRDLDELPFLHREMRYLKDERLPKQVFNPPGTKDPVLAGLAFSRGCPYQCTFCCSPKMWNREVAWRSVSRAVDEIEYLQREFGVDTLQMQDLTFNLNKKRVLAFCEEIIRRRIKISWIALCDFKVDSETLAKMKEAGCYKISWGLESPIQETRAKILKRKSDIKEVLQWADNLGIINRVFLMLGFPWETLETIETTSQLLLELAIDEPRFVFATPFPGTVLWEETKDSLLFEDLERFTVCEPVMKCGIPPDRLLALKSEMTEGYYSSVQYKERVAHKIRRHPELQECYEDSFEILGLSLTA